MINGKHRTAASVATLFLLAMLVVSFSGCIGALSQLMYVIKGPNAPAAYDGLIGKRVAVVCVSDASAYGPDTLTYTISKAVGMKLAQGVKKIDIIPTSKVESWVDQNGWDELNFSALGKGVDAERVLAIEVASYSIHEGATIYKGRAELTVTVYDMEKNAGSQVAYSFGPQEFSFPKNGSPAIQSNDRQFEAFFLARMTQSISDHFMKHDQFESFADDAMMPY